MAGNRLVGDGQFGFQVVGESHHQTEIEQIVGGSAREGAHFRCTAILRPEPSNPYDPNAVEVLILNRQVGYIPAFQAPEMCAVLCGSPAECDATIQGGWHRGTGDTGFFGVRLNIIRPFAFVVGRDAPGSDSLAGRHRMEIALVLLAVAALAAYLLYKFGFAPIIAVSGT
jgi:HIRAN domain